MLLNLTSAWVQVSPHLPGGRGGIPALCHPLLWAWALLELDSPLPASLTHRPADRRPASGWQRHKMGQAGEQQKGWADDPCPSLAVPKSPSRAALPGAIGRPQGAQMDSVQHRGEAG